MQQAALDRGDTAEAQAATAKTSTRKLSELTLAVHLEQTMTKDQILTGYLNTIYFGEGAYGVQERCATLLRGHREGADPPAGSHARRAGPVAH